MGPDQPGCVLVVDDEDAVRRAIARQVRAFGYRALEASSARHAFKVIAAEGVDVIISDVEMPDTSGLEFLQGLRNNGLELPVLFLTGRPSIDAAAEAVERSAFRYLLKPVAPEVLRNAIDAAMRTVALARARNEIDGRETLEADFVRALPQLHVHVQPIVSVETRSTVGFEALMRSADPALPHPGAVIGAAEKLGALHALGRHMRSLTAAVIACGPPEARFFVNLHPTDLADPHLYQPEAPLSQHAHRIVLELTERASLESIPDVTERLAALRAMRFEIAVDDLGAGYAGLNYFANLKPEIVKIDMSLIRGIDADPVKQRVVLAMVSLATTLGMEVVAEGVETRAERDAVVRLGCQYIQGYALARPAAPFPEARWE